jgi:O-antigen/teichoic acid export membrane protein
MILTVRRVLLGSSDLNWAFTDQAIVSAANFVTNIIIARALGLEAFGRFGFAWITIQLLNAVLSSLVAIPMMSVGPKQPKSGVDAYYGAVFFHQAIACAIFFLMTWAGANVSDTLVPQWRIGELALPLAAGSAGFQFQDFLRRYFFSRNRPGVAFANDCVKYVGQVLVLLLVMHFRTPTVAEVLWVIAVTSLAALLLGSIAVEGVSFGWDAPIQLEVMSRHWRFSKWLVVSSLLQWGSANLFQVAAGVCLGASVAGALRAAIILCAVTNIVFQGLLNVVPVRAAAALAHGGKTPFLNELYSATLHGAMGVLIVSMLLASAPEFWLSALFGDALSGYGTVLRWYALLQPIMFVEVPLAAGLRAIELTRPFFFEYLTANLITLVSIYPLMIQFGVIGIMVERWITWSIQLLLLGRALGCGLRRIV